MADGGGVTGGGGVDGGTKNHPAHGKIFSKKKTVQKNHILRYC